MLSESGERLLFINKHCGHDPLVSPMDVAYRPDEHAVQVSPFP